MDDTAIGDPSDGYVAPPRTTPNPFLKVDENVLAKLPKGTIVVSITPYGSSFWTQTARLKTKLECGTKHSYFLKVALEEKGREMLNGEFESMTALYAISPEFVPKPLAWGSYHSLPDAHFFLCDFHDMIEELPPDIDNFTKRLADLHRRSISASPGKFGFHICTYMGPLPQDNNWCDTWEEFYIQGMKRMLALEKEVQGPSEELEALTAQLFEKVIPRLLRPMETLGNKITPVLIHGDLWYGNVCTDRKTREPIVFDACAFWAHNEYEIGTWRAPRYRFGQKYIKSYFKHYNMSAPAEDADDRNALYSIRYNLHSSCAYSTSKRFRQDVIDEMRRLVDKFPDGYEGWVQEKIAQGEPSKSKDT